MDSGPLTAFVADADDGFARTVARRLGELGLAEWRIERGRSRDDLRRVSTRADVDLVLLADAGDETTGALRRALAARWRGPLAAALTGDDDGGKLARLARCARERRKIGALLDHDALRYRAAFEHAADATLLLSGHGHVLHANPASARLFRTETEDLLGRDFEELFAPRERAEAARLLRCALAGDGAAPEGELVLSAPGEATARLVLSGVFDESGRALFCVLQLGDVTARRRAEEEARRKQRVLEAVLRVQAQVIRAPEPRLVFTEILSRFVGLTGSAHGWIAEVADESGRAVPIVRASTESAAEGAANEQDAELRDPQGIFARVLASGETFVADGLLLDPRIGGFPLARAPLETFVAIPLMRGRRAVGLVALAGASRYPAEAVEELRPLTATAAGVLENLWYQRRRDEAERELRESRRALATLMAHLPGMAYRCHDDEPRTLEFASDGALELTGLGAAALVERREREFADLIHEDDRERVHATVRWALLAKRRFEVTWRLVRPDGVERVVWEQGQGVYSPSGELSFVEGFLTDVTDRLRAEAERRRLEARVLHAQKLESLGLLAGGIAHDLNNLLLGILGNTALARREGERSGARLDAIDHAATRAAELAEHMLAYTGRGALSPKPLDLSALVARARGALERLVEPTCRLELDLAGDLPLVATDAARLQDLLAHTLRNATEAAPTGGGRIAITTRRRAYDEDELHAFAGAPVEPGEYVVLEIADDGAGMSAATLARACDPFFTTKDGGRGLGLSSVLGNIRAHGGAMAIESEPGVGTRVRLLFPPCSARDVAPPPAALPAPPRPARASRARAARTVLVVDDERIVRDLARTALEDAGYRVLAAEDGERGVELFRENAGRIAAVLLDLTMPRLGGEGALAEIRRMRPDARVLLTSGWAEQDAMHRIASRAGVEFLPKPWRLEDLVAKLSALIAAGDPARP